MDAETIAELLGGWEGYSLGRSAVKQADGRGSRGVDRTAAATWTPAHLQRMRQALRFDPRYVQALGEGPADPGCRHASAGSPGAGDLSGVRAEARAAALAGAVCAGHAAAGRERRPALPGDCRSSMWPSSSIWPGARSRRSTRPIWSERWGRWTCDGWSRSRWTNSRSRRGIAMRRSSSSRARNACCGSGRGRGREDVRPFFELLGAERTPRLQGRGHGHERRLREEVATNARWPRSSSTCSTWSPSTAAR